MPSVFRVIIVKANMHGGYIMKALKNYKDSVTNLSELSVLLVEDDKLQQKIYQTFLSDIGFGCIEMVSSAEKVVDQPLEKFSFIMSDLYLGSGKNGIELADYVKQRYKSMPFLLIITENNPAISKARKECTINEFLQKPFTKEALNEVVKKNILHQNATQTNKNLVFSLQKFTFLYQHFLSSQLAAAVKKVQVKRGSEYKRALVVSPVLFEQKLVSRLLKRLGFAVVMVDTKQDLMALKSETFDLIIVSRIFEANPFHMGHILESLAQGIMHYPVSFLITSENTLYENFQFKFDRVFCPKFTRAI
jgi:CheY-like chemotaxis protein